MRSRGRVLARLSGSEGALILEEAREACGALSEAAASPRLGAARGQGCSHLSKHKNQLGEDGNTGKSCHSWGSTNVHGILGILTLQQFKPIPGTFVGMSQGFWQNQSPRPFQLPHLVEPVRKSPTPAHSSEEAHGSLGPLPHITSGGLGVPRSHPDTLRLLLGIQPQAQVWWAFLESPVPRPVLCLWKACLQPRTVIRLASAEGMAGGGPGSCINPPSPHASPLE